MLNIYQDLVSSSIPVRVWSIFGSPPKTSLAEFVRLGGRLVSSCIIPERSLEPQASAINRTKELALHASEWCSGVAVGDLLNTWVRLADL
jgi:hypothetical protein